MTFLPLPLLGNPHVQTILGTLVNAAPARLPVQTRLVPLPDGDTIVLHETPPRVAVPKNLRLMGGQLGGQVSGACGSCGGTTDCLRALGISFGIAGIGSATDTCEKMLRPLPL